MLLEHRINSLVSRYESIGVVVMTDLSKMKRLHKEFFFREGTTVAKELLGKLLVREYDGKILVSRIVETESYIGKIDKASHAYGGKITERVKPLYMEGGVAYVYFIYGLYHCFNIINSVEGDAQGVLVRAVEPILGIDHMSENRYKKPYEDLTRKQILNLTSGPSKLCIALDINKDMNTKDLINGTEIYVAEDDFVKGSFDIVQCKRIGIDYAEEAIDFPWRFYIKDNPFVSIKAKKDENVKIINNNGNI